MEIWEMSNDFIFEMQNFKNYDMYYSHDQDEN